MPISEDQAFLVARSTAYDRDGSRVGAVAGIYSDNHTGRPEWVTVAVEPTDRPPGEGPATGNVRFAPLASASYSRSRLLLDVTLAQMVAAPVIPDGEEIDARAETALYHHYGLSPAGDTDVHPETGTTPRSEGDTGAHSLLPPPER